MPVDKETTPDVRPPSKFVLVAGGHSGHKGAHSGTVAHRHWVLTLLAPPKLLSSN